MDDADDPGRSADAGDGEGWPPREARVRAALWRGEGHLLRGEWAHGARTLLEAVPIAAEADVVRGLRLLCAAGYQAREGEVERARAQLGRARARLAPFLPVYEDVDLAAVLDAVAEAVEARADG